MYNVMLWIEREREREKLNKNYEYYECVHTNLDFAIVVGYVCGPEMMNYLHLHIYTMVDVNSLI